MSETDTLEFARGSLHPAKRAGWYFLAADRIVTSKDLFNGAEEAVKLSLDLNLSETDEETLTVGQHVARLRDLLREVTPQIKDLFIHGGAVSGNGRFFQRLEELRLPGQVRRELSTHWLAIVNAREVSPFDQLTKGKIYILSTEINKNMSDHSLTNDNDVSFSIDDAPEGLTGRLHRLCDLPLSKYIYSLEVRFGVRPVYTYSTIIKAALIDLTVPSSVRMFKV